jgi:hypothetical protein
VSVGLSGGHPEQAENLTWSTCDRDLIRSGYPVSLGQVVCVFPAELRTTTPADHLARPGVQRNGWGACSFGGIRTPPLVDRATASDGEVEPLFRSVYKALLTRGRAERELYSVEFTTDAHAWGPDHGVRRRARR